MRRATELRMTAATAMAMPHWRAAGSSSGGSSNQPMNPFDADLGASYRHACRMVVSLTLRARPVSRSHQSIRDGS